jgi:hypothetical protein
LPTELFCHQVDRAEIKAQSENAPAAEYLQALDMRYAAAVQNKTYSNASDVTSRHVTHLVVVEVLPLGDVLLDGLGLLLFLLLVFLIYHVTLVI